MNNSPKFAADFMLGKTAKALRLLGIDTIYIREPDRKKLFEIALKEGRIILTRAHNLPKNDKIFVLKSEKVDEQIKEIIEKFKPVLKPFTRCIECNTKLQIVDKSKVKGKVPFFVYQTHEEFAYCPNCDKYYWEGTHYEVLEKRVKKWLSYSS